MPSARIRSEREEIIMEQTKAHRYISGSISKAMLQFAIPYLLGMVLQSFYGAVDLFVVGQFAETADVSAVTIGSQVMNMATQLILGLATGVTVLIGQQFGAKDHKGLMRTVFNASALFAGIAVVLTAVYLLCSNGIVTLMQTPEEAVEATKDYLFYCSLGILFIVGYNLISSIWMGQGNTVAPFVFIAVACIINITLDIVLVKIFGMGAKGAAIATTVAQIGSCLFSLLYIGKKGMGFPVNREAMKLRGSVIKHIVAIGVPVAVQNVLVGVSFLFITAIINQVGLAASAAAGVVEKLFAFFFMPAAAFGAGVSTISAQNMGAGKPKRALKSVWTGIWMALVPSVIIVVISQFFGGSMARLFSSDAEVIQLAAEYLRSYVLDCILVCFIFCMNGYFNGTGASWFSLTHSLITTLLVRMPFSYLFSRLPNTSLYFIGWAAPLSSFISLILCIAFLVYRRKRQHRAQRTA